MNHYQQILNLLKRLKKDHPSYNIGRHISTALDDYDLWGLSDKEFLFALQKYEFQLTMDKEDDVDKIMKEGMNLNQILFDEEEEE